MTADEKNAAVPSPRRRLCKDGLPFSDVGPIQSFVVLLAWAGAMLLHIFGAVVAAAAVDAVAVALAQVCEQLRQLRRRRQRRPRRCLLLPLCSHRRRSGSSSVFYPLDS